MNKKGFTLVELIAVIVLIALVSMLTFPNLNNLRKNNNEKQFKTYEDMMVEWTKVQPNYKNRNHICLSELHMKKINDNMNCSGYVLINNNQITPYLSCSQNNSKVYETEGFNASIC